MPEVFSSNANEFIATGVVLVGGLVVYWLAGIGGRRYVKRMEEKGLESGARAMTLWTVLRRALILVLVATGVLFVFSIWGWSLAPLLGIGTVLAAALGFGAQDLVKDFLAGIFILAEDQYQIGDVVTIAGTSGLVEDIQLRVTVLRDLEGNAHFVPNGQITVASNFTSKYAQPVIDVGIAYEADVDKALDLLRDELEKLANDPEYSELIPGPVEVMGVNELADSAVILRARLTTDADARWTIRREGLLRIKKRFEEEGITIPFPQITINRKD